VDWALEARGFGDGGFAFFDQCDAHENPLFWSWWAVPTLRFPLLVP
jgi:hypothetical protein